MPASQKKQHGLSARAKERIWAYVEDKKSPSLVEEGYLTGEAVCTAHSARERARRQVLQIGREKTFKFFFIPPDKQMDENCFPLGLMFVRGEIGGFCYTKV